jgi:hypothetical protein
MYDEAIIFPKYRLGFCYRYLWCAGSAGFAGFAGLTIWLFLSLQRPPHYQYAIKQYQEVQGTSDQELPKELYFTHNR